jgi:hypothetical protein
VRQLSLFLTRKLKSRLLARTVSASALVMAPWYHLQCVGVCRENRGSIMNLCSYKTVCSGLGNRLRFTFYFKDPELRGRNGSFQFSQCFHIVCSDSTRLSKTTYRDQPVTTARVKEHQSILDGLKRKACDKGHPLNTNYHTL